VRKEDGKKQILLDHLTEVAEKSEAFASKIGLGSYGRVIGLLHDVGKYSDDFQRYIKSAEGMINSDEDDYVDASGLRGKIDHSSAGAQIIYGEMARKDRERSLVAQFLCLCLASHHSGLIDCISPDGADTYSKRMNKITERTHVDQALERFASETGNPLAGDLKSREFVDNLLAAFKQLRISQDSKETFLLKYALT
jgi:CRISPR-associated endonuclease/helicase Cas3